MGTIKYNIVERNNPSDPKGPNIYYPQYRRNGVIDIKKLSEKIASETGYSTSICRGVIFALIEVIPGFLSLGFDVSLEDLGLFYLHIKGNAKKKPEEFTHHDIKDLEVRFRVFSEIRKQMEDISFEYIHKRTALSVFRQDNEESDGDTPPSEL